MKDSVTFIGLEVCAANNNHPSVALAVITCIMFVGMIGFAGWLLWQELDR